MMLKWRTLRASWVAPGSSGAWIEIKGREHYPQGPVTSHPDHRVRGLKWLKDDFHRTIVKGRTRIIGCVD